VQATARNARIDFEDVCHVTATVGRSAVPCIATKERIFPQANHIGISDVNGYRHSFASCGRMSAMNFACTALLVLRRQLTGAPDRP
jgi:hypothetical protein